MVQKVNHIALLIDTSGSMQSHAAGIIKQFNDQAKQINEQSEATGQQTKLSLYTFGPSANRPLLFEVPLDFVSIKSITRDKLKIDGGTPMYDCVGMAIEDLSTFNKALAGTADHGFVLICLTDGEENISKNYSAGSLRTAISKQIATDMWSFVFLVPFGSGYKERLAQRLGVSEGNIEEWDTTSAAGHQKAAQATQSGITNYFRARAIGKRSVSTFFQTDLSGTASKQVRKDLDESTHLFKQAEVTAAWVAANKGAQIRDFCVSRFRDYQLGDAFYELTKTEEVQPHKHIVLENKISGKLYGDPKGDDGRTLLGLPVGGKNIKVKPGDHATYRIYINSTSVNRKLVAGTKVLYVA